MANPVFGIIRALPDSALAEFRAGVAQDIASRKRRGREFTSLRRYLSIAALELECRARQARLLDEIDAAESHFAWNDRADLR